VGHGRNKSYKILFGNTEGTDDSGGMGVHWRIILKSVLRKETWRLWNQFIWLRIGNGFELL
jgi:hypothetical protein